MEGGRAADESRGAAAAGGAQGRDAPSRRVGGDVANSAAAAAAAAVAKATAATRAAR